MKTCVGILIKFFLMFWQVCLEPVKAVIFPCLCLLDSRNRFCQTDTCMHGITLKSPAIYITLLKSYHSSWSCTSVAQYQRSTSSSSNNYLGVRVIKLGQVIASIGYTMSAQWATPNILKYIFIVNVLSRER